MIIPEILHSKNFILRPGVEPNHSIVALESDLRSPTRVVSLIIMKRVEIDLPDETFAGLDRESTELATELRAAAAAKWYEVGRVSQEVAAQIAGVSRSEFVSVLSRLQVSPMQESVEEALTGAQLLLQP